MNIPLDVQLLSKRGHQFCLPDEHLASRTDSAEVDQAVSLSNTNSQPPMDILSRQFGQIDLDDDAVGFTDPASDKLLDLAQPYNVGLSQSQGDGEEDGTCLLSSLSPNSDREVGRAITVQHREVGGDSGTDQCMCDGCVIVFYNPIIL